MNIGLSNPSPEFCFQDTAQCLYLRSKIGRQKHVGYRRFSCRLYTLIQTEVITQMQSFPRYTDEWEKSDFQSQPGDAPICTECRCK